MKRVVFSLVAALMIASLFLTPAAAASLDTTQATGNCGTTYTVQYFDYLAKIARYCGISVSSLLALNPQIVNANIIYPGQVLRLTTDVPIPSAPRPNPFHPVNPIYGYGLVSLSARWANAGDDVTVYVRSFPANTPIDFRVGKEGETFSVVYDSTTDAYGRASQVITIPTSAERGEHWVVQVVTTDLKVITSATSYPIYISNYTYYNPYPGLPRVTLSATRAVVGGNVTVHVSGFPANTIVDVRVGKSGADFSVAYDAITSSTGTATQVIAIPSGANPGEYWTVRVLTTELKTITSATSSGIYIVD